MNAAYEIAKRYKALLIEKYSKFYPKQTKPDGSGYRIELTNRQNNYEGDEIINPCVIFDIIDFSKGAIRCSLYADIIFTSKHITISCHQVHPNLLFVDYHKDFMTIIEEHLIDQIKVL